jgi:DNA polymerase-3 subunit alpha (Gram-positive type)
MTVRIAYFKYYHPAAFYAAAFSVKSSECDYSLMCRGKETALTEYTRLKSMEKKDNTAKDENTLILLELALEMYDKGITFAPLNVYKSEMSRFLPAGKNILPPLCTVQGLGSKVAEAIVTAREEGNFKTLEDFKARTKVNKTVLEVLRGYHVLDGIPETDQMSLFEL